MTSKNYNTIPNVGSHYEGISSGSKSQQLMDYEAELIERKACVAKRKRLKVIGKVIVSTIILAIATATSTAIMLL